MARAIQAEKAHRSAPAGRKAGLGAAAGSDKAAEGLPAGTLYVVGTPIGNLKDITLRALEVLAGVHAIAAENVTRTRQLCRQHGIFTTVVSYRRSNERLRTPELLGLLANGKNIALVSDAGTPGVSDPGGYLIHSAARAGFSVRPVPGPSAVGAALSVAGMPAESYLFAGFLPNRAPKRRRALQQLASEPRTVVFFEAPHRIRETLADVLSVLGDRQVVVLREMTKLYEEILRGRASKVLESLVPENLRGEFTVVLEGCQGKWSRQQSNPEPAEIAARLAHPGATLKGAARELACERGLPYRAAYRLCLEVKRRMEAGDYFPRDSE